MATTEAGGGMPELRDHIAEAITAKTFWKRSGHDVVDAVLAEIASAGYVLVNRADWGLAREDWHFLGAALRRMPDGGWYMSGTDRVIQQSKDEMDRVLGGRAGPGGGGR